MRKKELRCFLTEIRQQEVLRINAAIAHERQMETLHKQRHDIGEILGRRVEESTIDAARRVVQSIETCNKLRVAAEEREFISDGRLDKLCEILSATTETVEDAARRLITGSVVALSKKYDEALELCDEEDITPAEQIKRMRVEIEALNRISDDRMRDAGTWRGLVEKILRRLKPKHDESPEDTIERWLNGFDNEMSKSLVEAGRKLDELENANQGLRTEVAALQEKLRSSIQRADFAQIEADRLKTQNVMTPKRHPVKEGEWVSKDWKQAAQVVSIDVEHAEYKIRFLGSNVVEVWHFGHCKPCDPPTLEALQAHHDRVVDHMQDEATRLGQLLTAAESERDSLRTEVTLLRAELDTEKDARKVDVAELGFELRQRKGETLLAAARRVCNAEIKRLKGECVVLRLEVLELKGISKNYKESLLQKHGEIEAIAKALGEHEGQTDEEAVLALVAERDSLLTARHTGWVHLKASNQTPRHGEAAQILAFIVHYEGSERRWDATLCDPCAPPDKTEVTVPGPDAA